MPGDTATLAAPRTHLLFILSVIRLRELDDVARRSPHKPVVLWNPGVPWWLLCVDSHLPRRHVQCAHYERTRVQLEADWILCATGLTQKKLTFSADSYLAAFLVTKHHLRDLLEEY